MQKVHVVDDRFYNVADAHVSGKAEMMPILFAFAEQTGQAYLANFAAAVYASKNEKGDFLPHTTRTLRRLIYQSEALHKMATYPILYSLHSSVEYLPDLQIAALREGTFALHVKGGHNKEGHNHNDVGSFTLYDGSTPVLVDVGINTYTGLHFKHETRYTAVPWTRSLYHNLPIVNGMEQKNGREHCADAFSVREGEITVSFAKAYLPEANVESLTRELNLSKNGMTCTDRFTFTGKAHHITEVLMTIFPVHVENGVAILGDQYRVSAEGAEISAEQILFEDASLERDWGADRVTRILLDFKDSLEICIKVEKI